MENSNQEHKAGAIYTIPQDPLQNAWYTAFFIENHLDPVAYSNVAQPEQMRFMVVFGEDERYYPCSDKMFEAIMARQKPSFLLRRYEEAMSKVLELLDSQVEDSWDREFMESLLRTKYTHETRDGMMIPSRLEKRLLKIFLDRTQIRDPYFDEKSRRNRNAFNALTSRAFRVALNQVDETLFSPRPGSLEEVRLRSNHLELSRLLALLSEPALWMEDEGAHQVEDFTAIMNRALAGEGAREIGRLFSPGQAPDGGYVVNPRKIMWLLDESGESMIDLFIIRFLAGLGHKIIVVFKEGPLFTKVDFGDAREDPCLRHFLHGAFVIRERDIAKNDLVDLLKKDLHILTLSDGTMEDLNLLVTSTTFARTFKEADLIVARGAAQRRRFFDTSFGFTQDILSIATDEDGKVSVLFKPRHPEAIKFSHQDLEDRARAIINQMAEAKKNGMTVMFYSGIVGSIPGKVDVAKSIMSTFVNHLREQSDSTFIINPSEYFEQGMDADDLMYMWEMVQRSGFLDIWRFQTYDDIVKAFDLQGKKVPPEWVGKDATFSTGCTKEMHIAEEVAQENTEMQIIGPPRDKFYRRGEYAVGKLFDKRLEGSVPAK